MHAMLEDIVHMAVLEAVADAAGVTLRGALAAIGDADLVEIGRTRLPPSNSPASAAADR